MSGEADVLEGLILTPAAQDVGERGEGVLVHGRAVAGLLEHQAPHSCHRKSQDAIHEDQELRVLESLPFLLWIGGAIGTCHHPLLQDPPRQVRHLEITEFSVVEFIKCQVITIKSTDLFFSPGVYC